MAVELAPLNPVNVGIDVGQIHDPTAIAVAEVCRVHTGKFRFDKEYHKPAYVDANMIFHKAVDADEVMRSRYIIRHIERVALGTSYPDVAAYIADMLSKSIFAHRDVRVFINVTGVGRPVYDDLTREIKRREATRHISLRPITINGGMLYNRPKSMLAKSFPVSRMQALLQGAGIDGPATREMQRTT